MRKSAGILLYRYVANKEVEVFLVHPGGPFWKEKEIGVWTIPKGELEEGEDALQTAKREFAEETGSAIEGNFIALTPVRQKAGKVVMAWAVEGDIDPATIVSNTFPLQWPPKSGKWITVPEVDKGGWFSISEAKEKINPAQAALIDELLTKLNS